MSIIIMKLHFFKKRNKTVFLSYIQHSHVLHSLLEQEDCLEKQVWGLTSGQNQIPVLFPGPSPPAWYMSLLGIPATTQRNSICHRAGSRLLRRPHVLRREELQGGPQAGFLLTENRSGSQSIQQKFSWSTMGSVASENPSSGLSTRTWKNPGARRKSANLQGRSLF